MKSTKHWFYLWSLWRFLERVDFGHKNDWKPNVYGQVKSGLMAD
jgi:methionyl-tRNA synthetase